MHYVILCYNTQDEIAAWPKEQDEKVMADLAAVEQKLAKAGKLGPVARLQMTHTAKTLRKAPREVVLDGPFAETKEQLLGFFVVDCASETEAIEAAKDLAKANPGPGAYEIRPLQIWKPGAALAP